MKSETIGKALTNAVREALEHKEAGRRVRPEIDVASLRKQLDMTQREFCTTYHIKLQTLRNWEQKKRYPDTAGLAYLACIAKRPKLINHILN